MIVTIITLYVFYSITHHRPWQTPKYLYKETLPTKQNKDINDGMTKMVNKLGLSWAKLSTA